MNCDQAKDLVIFVEKNRPFVVALQNYFQHPGLSEESKEKKVCQGDLPSKCVSLNLYSISFRFSEYRNILLVTCACQPVILCDYRLELT